MESEQLIVRRSGDPLGPSSTDWAALAAMTDEDIERAIDDDPDTWRADEQIAGVAAFHVFPTDDHRWQWRLLDADGAVVAMAASSANSHSECVAQIERLRRAATTVAMFTG